MHKINWDVLDLQDLERYQSALDAIDPTALDYEAWRNVGMACKDAGLSCEAWDEWSRNDPDRYEEGECARKWDSFTNGTGITAGTLIYMAGMRGWNGGKSATPIAPPTARGKDATDPQDAAPVLDLEQLDYADEIGDYPAMAEGFTWDEMTREQLRFMFDSDEYVCVCNTTSDGITMRAGEAIQRAETLLAGGAHFVVVNPTDGQGRKNANVSAYRYTLIESDELPKPEQLDIMRRLRLPCATITDSGNKSIHAVVKVDAEGPREYKERVKFLHAVCNANGLKVDSSCKNPARLTRLAGGMRGENVQKLIDAATGPFMGCEWGQWVEWVTKRAPRRVVDLANVTDAAQDESTHDATESTQDVEGVDADEYECTDEYECAETEEQDAYEDTDARPGTPKTAPTQAALVRFMHNDPTLSQAFGTNVLDSGLYVCGSLPWDESGERRRWTDADDEWLFVYMQGKTGTKSRRNVSGAFTIVAAANRFNPIVDMLDTLPEWDGTARADYLLWVLFGCEDTPYTRAVSHAFMRGAVLRGYEPGCKFDSVLTLIGPQGCGKSYGTRRMAMRDEFLCESVTDLTDHKLTAEQTTAKWICELAELEGMTGRRLTGVKQAITMQHITTRMAYARHPIDLPRSCVFVATTNEACFLADRTGNRRFWPIRCATSCERGGWDTATDREVSAFVMLAWAEVVHEYKTARASAADADAFREAYPTTLTAGMEREADTMRDAASVEDTRIGVIREWLADAALREGITRVCARMVAEKALGIDMARQRGHQVTNEIAYILDTCEGWQSVGKQRVRDYGTCRAWDYQPGADGKE